MMYYLGWGKKAHYVLELEDGNWILSGRPDGGKINEGLIFPEDLEMVALQLLELAERGIDGKD